MDLKHLLKTESVGNLPIRDAIEIHASTVVRAAIASMEARQLGCAVLVDEQRRPIGLFTDRSVLKVLVEGTALDDTPVRDFAEFECPIAKRQDPISVVWNAVRRDGQRYVCVVDSEDRIIGVTGQRGLSEYIAECFPQKYIIQRLGTRPWLSEREGA